MKKCFKDLSQSSSYPSRVKETECICKYLNSADERLGIIGAVSSRFALALIDKIMKILTTDETLYLQNSGISALIITEN